MIAIKRFSLATAVGLALSLLVTSEGFALTYTKIADSNDLFSKFGFFPAINNDGTITFSADLDAGGSGIYIGSGENTSLIADRSGQFSSFFPPAIADTGLVAFKAVLDEGTVGIYTSENTVPIANSRVAAGLGDLAINSKGIVAFSQILDQGIRAVLTNYDGINTTIADSSDTNPYSRFEGIAINNTGTVAFTAELKATGRGIYTVNNGNTTTIADTNGEFDFLFNPAINNAGTVAFKGVLKNLAGEGIYTSDGQTLTKIADNSSVFDFFENPAINNQGTVAFKGVLKGGGLGIYTGVNPVTDKVIALGDSLFGSTVTDLYFSNRGLNDKNQFAFYAKLADGRTGVFRADSDYQEPTNSVPEPGLALGLLTVGALGTVLGRKRD
ncbi:hypothetical protein H6G81_20750 [Scytonema hofmannii FACHB-248]|uniref:PEP-CTERM sorting domain-containing protein n=1 Tax=Scytonema hofmannii FACHB-248 TaxID=1842502 RepID=A0ABR8GUZ0_9CYAN|nr:MULTISPECIES: choice-of-anchor tandem repeat NxxGxxAF-containing protein [Nostocales]MBD2606894.1 hypothetical protein [Scytonema hofmannii FACHB-248]